MRMWVSVSGGCMVSWVTRFWLLRGLCWMEMMVGVSCGAGWDGCGDVGLRKESGDCVVDLTSASCGVALRDEGVECEMRIGDMCLVEEVCEVWDLAALCLVLVGVEGL